MTRSHEQEPFKEESEFLGDKGGGFWGQPPFPGEVPLLPMFNLRGFGICLFEEEGTLANLQRFSMGKEISS